MTVANRRVEVSMAAMRIQVELTVLDCPNCGVIFGAPDDLIRRRRDDKASFYCPNGHSMSYNDSEADRLRRKLKQAQADAEWYKKGEQDALDARNRAEASLRATRGHVTRLRNRAVAGTCPFGCKRHFANLQRHVASKHPDQQLEGEA